MNKDEYNEWNEIDVTNEIDNRKDLKLGENKIDVWV